MIDRLIDGIIEKQNPTVVGLDPRLEIMPQFIKEKYFNEYDKTPKAVGKIFFAFNKGIIDNIYDIVPAVKPQIAMYERYGHEGVQCYIETNEYAKSKGLIVIGDIKRGDITSTAQAYAEGHIGEVKIENRYYNIYNQDAITLSPYLGFDSIEPYIKYCKEYDKGLFILVKTSNPNSGEIQDLETKEGKLYEKIGELVSRWGKALMGKHGYSQIGAVVGATHPKQAKALRNIMPDTYFLVPGYGAQGAKAEDLKGCFNEDGLGAIINSSRGIIAAYLKESNKPKFSEKDFALAAREAAIHMRDDLQKNLF
jgi:orotidine-5'-phosphate decarboxylase